MNAYWFARRLRIGLLLCTLAAGLLVLHSPALAAVISVAAGDVRGLVAAINTANTNGESFNEIVLERGGVYQLNQVDNDIDGGNALPSITSVLIISTGPLERTSFPAVIDGQHSSGRIFHVSSGALALIDIVLTGGGADEGGGLFNRGPVTVLVNSVVSNSSAQLGGGIFNGIFNSVNGGSFPSGLVLATSTIRDNHADTAAGGILNRNGIVMMTDSTITHNVVMGTVGRGGGGIRNERVQSVGAVHSRWKEVPWTTTPRWAVVLRVAVALRTAMAW